MSLNFSSSSEHSKKSLEESIPTEKTKKFKKPGVISHLTRRTVKPKEQQHTPMKKKTANPKLVAGGISEVTKTSTLPRSFKPNKTSTTSLGQSLGRFGLTRSSNHKKSGPPSPQPSTVKQSSKCNLSFSELKKQHQFYLKEVEKLKNSIGELEQKHIEEKDEMKLELVMAENTIESLRNELVLKEDKLEEKEKCIRDLHSQMAKLNLDKERLLMVIESTQRDALTGEKITPDTLSWQAAMEENKKKMENYSLLLNSMTKTLQVTDTELKVQHQQIQDSIEMFTNYNYIQM